MTRPNVHDPPRAGNQFVVAPKSLRLWLGGRARKRLFADAIEAHVGGESRHAFATRIRGQLLSPPILFDIAQ